MPVKLGKLFSGATSKAAKNVDVTPPRSGVKDAEASNFKATTTARDIDRPPVSTPPKGKSTPLKAGAAAAALGLGLGVAAPNVPAIADAAETIVDGAQQAVTTVTYLAAGILGLYVVYTVIQFMPKKSSS